MLLERLKTLQISVVCVASGGFIKAKAKHKTRTLILRLL